MKIYVVIGDSRNISNHGVLAAFELENCARVFLATLAKSLGLEVEIDEDGSPYVDELSYEFNIRPTNLQLSNLA